MTQILFSVLGVLLAFMIRDIFIISVKIINHRRSDKMIKQYQEESRKMQEKFNEWLDEFKPEEYGNAKHFALQVCSKCDKLRKNVVEENDEIICLDCTVNGTE